MSNKRPNIKLARNKACDLLDNFGMKKPPFDPRRIANILGIGIMYRAFPRDRDVSGYIQKNGRNIIINNDISVTRKIFTMAHEIGHAILHEGYVKSSNYHVLRRDNTYPNGKPACEVEADIFAAHLLVPFFSLKEYSPLATIAELATLYVVNADLIKNQLYWLRTTGNE